MTDFDHFHRESVPELRRANGSVAARAAGRATAPLAFRLPDGRAWTYSVGDRGIQVVPGDGDLPVGRFIQAALDTGYKGAFELEMVGPKIEAEGYEPALRRAVERANLLLEEVVK